MEGAGIPRHGMNVVDESGKKIGEVTSGTMSPISKAIGMAYVPKELSKSGNTILIDIRNNQSKASVVKMPFTEAHYYRAPAN